MPPPRNPFAEALAHRRAQHLASNYARRGRGIKPPSDTAEGEVLRWITLPNGKRIPITAPSGQRQVVRNPGSKFYTDPGTGEPLELDMLKPGGVKSAWDGAAAKTDKNTGEVFKELPGHGRKVIGKDPHWENEQAQKALKAEQDAAAKNAKSEAGALKDEQKQAETDRKAEEAEAKRQRDLEKIGIGASKRLVEESDDQFYQESRAAREKAELARTDVSSDRKRLAELDDALDAETDTDKRAGMETARKTLADEIAAKAARVEELEIEVTRAAARREAWERVAKPAMQRAISAAEDESRLKALPNTGRRTPIQDAPEPKAEGKAETPPPAGKASFPIALSDGGRPLLLPGMSMEPVDAARARARVRDAFADIDGMNAALAARDASVRIDWAGGAQAAFKENLPRLTPLPGMNVPRDWLTPAAGVAQKTAKEVGKADFQLPDGYDVTKPAVGVGGVTGEQGITWNGVNVGRVVRDQHGLPRAYVTGSASPSLENGKPYDGVPEYADVAPQFRDYLTTQEGYDPNDEAEIRNAWAARHWPAGRIKQVLNDWQNANDDERADLLLDMQPEREREIEAWRARGGSLPLPNLRQLYLEGAISRQDARLLERTFSGTQPGHPDLKSGWEAFKTGSSQAAQAYQAALKLSPLTDGGSDVARRQKGTAEAAAARYLSEYFQKNSQRVDFDLEAFNRERDTLLGGEPINRIRAWSEDITQNGIGSMAGIATQLAKAATLQLSENERDMIAQQTSAAGWGLGNVVRDIFTPGSKNKDANKAADELFGAIDRETLTETQFKELAGKIQKAALGYVTTKELAPDQQAFYDPMNPESPLASALLAYKETRDPAYKALFTSAMMSTPGEQELQMRVAAHASDNNKIAPSDSFGLMRSSFRGAQVAPLQEVGLEVATSLIGFGVGKLVTGSVRTAKAAAAAGRGANLAQRAVLKFDDLSARFAAWGTNAATPGRNMIVQGAKIAGASAGGEAFEEGVMAMHDSGATFSDVWAANVQGALGGGMGLTPVFAVGGMAMNAAQRLVTEKRAVNAFVKDWNANRPDDPITAKDAKQLQGYLPRDREEKSFQLFRQVGEQLQANQKELVDELKQQNETPPAAPAPQRGTDEVAAPDARGAGAEAVAAPAPDEAQPGNAPAVGAPAEVLTPEAWDRANRHQQSNEWFEGGRANLEVNKAFNRAAMAGGADLATHGMAKVATLTGAIKALTDLLKNNLDQSRGRDADGARLHTAPLAVEKDSAAVHAGTTSGGTSYRDGPFILVNSAAASRSDVGIRTMETVQAVLVNEANAGQLDAIRKAIHAIRPDIIVELYSKADQVAATLTGKKKGQEVKGQALPTIQHEERAQQIAVELSRRGLSDAEAEQVATEIVAVAAAGSPEKLAEIQRAGYFHPQWGAIAPVLEKREAIHAEARVAAAEQAARVEQARAAMQEVNGIADPTLRAYADAALRHVSGHPLTRQELQILEAARAGVPAGPVPKVAVPVGQPKRGAPDVEMQDAAAGVPLAQVGRDGSVILTQAGLDALHTAMPRTARALLPVDERSQWEAWEQEQTARQQQEQTPLSPGRSASGVNNPVINPSQAGSTAGANAAVELTPPAAGEPGGSGQNVPQDVPHGTTSQLKPGVFNVPVTIRPPSGTERVQDVEVQAASPEEAAAKVAAMPTWKAMRSRGATVDVGAPQAVDAPQNQPAAPAPDQATPEEESTWQADAEAARAQVKPLATLLREAAAGFGYKIVDTGLPFGFEDRYGTFHSFGTQIFDKMVPGSDLGQWIDKVGNSPVADMIRDNMTSPALHRVWFGHDPLANLGTIIQEHGISALPEWAIQLAKDSLTKSGIPLPGAQWLVHNGVVGDRAATEWLSMNIGEVLGAGLGILGSYKLYKRAAAGQEIHAGWALLGIAFKLTGGVMSANPVLILTGLADAAIVVGARRGWFKAGFQKARESGKTAASQTPASEAAAKEPEKEKPQPAAEKEAQAAEALTAKKESATRALQDLKNAIRARVQAFDSVVAGKVQRGGGMEVERQRDGKIILRVDARRFLHYHAGSAPALIAQIIDHEVIHSGTLREFTDAEINDLFQRLPQKARLSVWQAYHAAEIKDGSLPARPANFTEEQGNYLGHEMLRMLVEDRVFQREITEAAQADPTLAAEIIRFLKRLVKQLRNLVEQADPEVRDLFRWYEERAVAALHRLGVEVPGAKPAPATELAAEVRNTGQRIARLLEHVRQQPAEKPVWYGITDRGIILSADGRVFPTAWEARQQMAREANRLGTWYAWDAGIVGNRLTKFEEGTELPTAREKFFNRYALVLDPDLLAVVRTADEMGDPLPGERWWSTREDARIEYDPGQGQQRKDVRLVESTPYVPPAAGADTLFELPARKRTMEGLRDAVALRIEQLETGRSGDGPDAREEKALTKLYALLERLEAGLAGKPDSRTTRQEEQGKKEEPESEAGQVKTPATGVVTPATTAPPDTSGVSEALKAAAPAEFADLPGGLSEAEMSRMALFDQVRADAARKVLEGETTRTAYGANWENMKSVGLLFDHFTIPDGWSVKEPWFGTGGGSWYATVEDAGGREYKLSVRDHEPTRADMGLPDYHWEVSKEWHPEEVNKAITKLEQRLQQRSSYIGRLRSDEVFRQAEEHKRARRELNHYETLIRENEKKADALEARGKPDKAANARIAIQQMRDGSTYRALVAKLNKANAEPLSESGAAGIKPKFEVGETQIPPQTPPPVNPESPGAEGRFLGAPVPARAATAGEAVRRESSTTGGMASDSGAAPEVIRSIGQRLAVTAADPAEYPALASAPRLSAFHNLSPKNLAYADRMGGLAVPSIAVLPEGQAISGFGSITLIGTRNLVDPKHNPVFDADAYTVRFPDPEYKRARTADAQVLVNKLRPFERQFEDSGITGTLWDNAVNNPNPQDSVQRLQRSLTGKAAFLAEQGTPITPVMMDKPIGAEWVLEPAFAPYRANPALISQLDANDEPANRTLAQAIRTAIGEYVRRTESGARVAKVLIDSYINKDTGLPLFGRTLGIEESLAAIGKQQVDTAATKDQLDTALAGREAALQQWAERQVLPMMGEPRLTLKGRKVPYTLDNIVQAMTSARVRGGENVGSFFGEGAARGSSATRFKDMEKMRSAAAVQIMPEEQVSAARETAKKLLADWREAVASHTTLTNWKGQPDIFGAFDASMRAIARWAKGSQTPAALRSALQQEDFANVPDALIEQGQKAAEAFAAAPVPYFESKPQRAVLLNEFIGAVIPDSEATGDTAAILQRHGIPFRTYAGAAAQQSTAAQFAQNLAEKGALFALPVSSRAMPRAAAEKHVFSKLKLPRSKVRVIAEPSQNFRGRYDPDGTITVNASHVGSIEEIDDVLFHHEAIHDAIETDAKVRQQADDLVNALTDDERADIEAAVSDYDQFGESAKQAERQVEAIRKLTANRHDLQSAWGRLVESVSIKLKKVFGADVSRRQAELTAARIVARGIRRLRKGTMSGKRGGVSLYQEIAQRVGTVEIQSSAALNAPEGRFLGAPVPLRAAPAHPTGALAATAETLPDIPGWREHQANLAALRASLGENPGKEAKEAAKAQAAKMTEAYHAAHPKARAIIEQRKAVSERIGYPIPPAWTNVQIPASGNYKATGIDASGQKQGEQTDEAKQRGLDSKFERGARVNEAIGKIVEATGEGLKNGSDEASVVRLMLLTGFRNGGDGTGKAKVKAYGATTLLAEHVTVDGDSVTFDFIGKSGVHQIHTVIDADLAADMLARKARGGRLFNTRPDKVIAFLRQASGETDIKAHDLRTWNATDLARVLVGSETAPETEMDYWLKRDAVADVVARKLGDTRSVVLEHYIDPNVFEKWREGATVTNDSRPAISRKVAESRGSAAQLGRSFEEYERLLQGELLPSERPSGTAERLRGRGRVEQGVQATAIAPGAEGRFLGAPVPARAATAHQANIIQQGQRMRNAAAAPAQPTGGKLPPARGAAEDAGSLLRDLFYGRHDALEAIMPGTKRLIQENRLDAGFARAAVKSMMDQVRHRITAAFGTPKFWNVKRKGKMTRFLSEMLPMASRLNATGFTPAGDLVFTNFDRPIGFISDMEMTANGYNPGDAVPLPGSATQQMVNIGPRAVERGGYILTEPMPATVQARLYTDFTQAYPEGAWVLEEFIMPGMEQVREVGPGGTQTPTFNRGSILNYLNDDWPPALQALFTAQPLPPVALTEGWTPDVARQKTAVAYLGAILRNFMAAARKTRTGERIESGDLHDLLEGFEITAFEAQMEKSRLAIRNKLINQTATSTPPPASGLREFLSRWTPMDDVILGTLKSYVLGRKADMKLIPAKGQPLTQEQRDLATRLLGDGVRFWGTDMALPRRIYQELIAADARDVVTNKFLRAVDWFIKRYVAGLMVDLGTFVVNVVSNPVLRQMAGLNRLMYALTSALHGDWAGAKLGTLEWAHLMRGLVMDQLPLLRRRILSALPPEIYDDNSTYAQADGIDPMKGAWAELKDFNPGAAFLKTIRYGAVDQGAKVGVHYALLRARASVAADKAKVKGAARKAFVRDWMNNARTQHRQDVEETYQQTLDFMLDMAGDVPAAIDPSQSVFNSGGQPSQIERVAKRGVFSLYRFKAAMARYGVRNTIGSVQTLIDPLLSAEKKAQAAANLLMMAGLAAMGWLLTGDEGDDDDDPLVGRQKDDFGRLLPQAVRTGGLVNMSKAGRMIAAWLRRHGVPIREDGAVEPGATAEDIWVKTSKLPLTSSALLLGHLVNGHYPDALDVTGQFWTDMYPSGPLMRLNPLTYDVSFFDKGKSYRVVAADQLLDLLTAPILPSRLRESVVRIVDPQDRLLKPEPDIGYNPGLKEVLQTNIPWMSLMVPPRATYESAPPVRFSAVAWRKEKLAAIVRAPGLSDAEKAEMRAEVDARFPLLLSAEARQYELLEGFGIPAGFVDKKRAGSREWPADLQALKDKGYDAASGVVAPGSQIITRDKMSSSYARLFYPSPDSLTRKTGAQNLLGNLTGLNILPVKRGNLRAELAKSKARMERLRTEGDKIKESGTTPPASFREKLAKPR